MVLTKTKRTSQGFVIEKNIGLKQEVCRLTCDSNRTVYHTELMPFLLYWLKDDQMFKKITVLEPITGRLLASEIKSKPVRSSGQFQLHFVCSSKEVLATYNVHDSRYLLDSIRYKKEWGRKGNVEYVMVETIPMVSDN